MWPSFCQTLSWLQKKGAESSSTVCSIPPTSLLGLWFWQDKDGARNWKFAIFPVWFWNVWEQDEHHRTAGTRREPCCPGRAAVAVSCASLESPRHCCSKLQRPARRSGAALSTGAKPPHQESHRGAQKPSWSRSSWVDTAEHRWEHWAGGNSGQHGMDNLSSQGDSFVLVICWFGGVFCCCFGLVFFFFLMGRWRAKFGGEHAFEAKTPLSFVNCCWVLLCYQCSCGYRNFQ